MFYTHTPHITQCFNRLIACYLFVACGAIAAFGQNIFNRHQLHEIRLSIPETSWFDSLQLYYNQALTGSPQRFLSTTLVADGDTLYQVGLRFKGKYSNYGFPGNKKPFRLDFNKFVAGQEFQGLKKLNLHNLAGDPSFLREYMAYDLFRYLGIEAPRASFAKVYINEVYWGCYEIAEEPDKTFLKQHFGNKNGNLFECVKTSALTWKGPDAASYPEFELKTDSVAGSWNNLIDWIDLFNHYYRFDFQQQLGERFDIDAYMKILAVDVLINNEDAYSSNGRNYFLYDDREAGKLRWIPWDYNLSFWDAVHQPIPTHPNGYFQPFIYRFHENAYLRKKYLTQYCRLLENEFSTYPFEQRSQEAYALIREAVEADTLKFYTTEQFYANRTTAVTVSMLRNNLPTDVYLPGLTNLFVKRKNELRKALFSSGCDCDHIEDPEELEGVLFPNPASDELTVYIEDDLASTFSGPTRIRMYDTSGRLVYDEPGENITGSFHCNINHLQQGLYVLRVFAAGKTFTTNYIKQ